MSDETEPENQELTEEKLKQLIEQLGITEETLEELYEEKKIDESTYNKIKEYFEKKKKKRNLWLAISAVALVLVIIFIFLFRSSTIDFRINTLSNGVPVQANVTLTYLNGNITGLTDENGQLIVKTPDNGDYNITAKYNGTVKELTGSLSEKTVDIDFGASEGAYVPEAGSVPNQVQITSSADSSRIQGASVIYKINNGRVLSNTTDSNGIVTIYAKPQQSVELIKIQADGYKLVNEITFTAQDLENGQPHIEQITLEPEGSSNNTPPGINATVETKINVKIKAIDGQTGNPIPNAQITMKSDFGIVLGSTITGSTGQGIIRDITAPQTVTVSGTKIGLTAQDVDQQLDENFQDTINIYFYNENSSQGNVTPSQTSILVKTADGQLVTQEVDWNLYVKKNGCVGNFNYDSNNLATNGSTTNGIINLNSIVNSSTGSSCYSMKVNSNTPTPFFDETSNTFTYGENTTIILTPINSSTSASVTVNISRYYGADANNSILNITDVGGNQYFGGYVVQGSPIASITIDKLRIGRIYQITAYKGVETASLQTSFRQSNNNVSLLLDGGNSTLNFHVIQVDQNDWNTILDPADLLGTIITVKQGNTIILNNVQCDNGNIAICDTLKATNIVKRGIDLQITAKKDGYIQTTKIGSRTYPGTMLLSGTNTPDINISMFLFTGCAFGDGSNGIVDGDPYNTTCGRITGVDFWSDQEQSLDTLSYGQYYATIGYMYNNTDVFGFRIEVDNKTNYADQSILLGGVEYNDLPNPNSQYRSGLYNLKIQQQKSGRTTALTEQTTLPIDKTKVFTRNVAGTDADFYDLNNSRAVEIEFRHDSTNLALEDPNNHAVFGDLTFLINVDDPLVTAQVPVYVTMWLKKGKDGNNKDIIVKRIPLNLTKIVSGNYFTHTASSKTYINNVSVNDFTESNVNQGSECNDQLLCSSLGTNPPANSGQNDNYDAHSNTCKPNYGDGFCSLGAYSKTNELYDNKIYEQQDVTVKTSMTDGIILCASGKTIAIGSGSCADELCRFQIDMSLNAQTPITMKNEDKNKIYDMIDGFTTYLNITLRPKTKPEVIQGNITSGDAVATPEFIDTISTTKKYSTTINKGIAAQTLYSNYTITCASPVSGKSATFNITFESKGDDNRCKNGETFNHGTGQCEVLKFAPPEIKECQNSPVYDKSQTNPDFVGLRNKRNEIILDYNTTAGKYQGTCFGILTKDQNNNYLDYTDNPKISIYPTVNDETNSKCSYITDGTNLLKIYDGITNWNNKFNSIGSKFDTSKTDCLLYGDITTFNTWKKKQIKSTSINTNGVVNAITTGPQAWEYGTDPRGRYSHENSWTERANQLGYEKDYFTLYNYSLTFGGSNPIDTNTFNVWTFFSKQKNNITEAFDKSYISNGLGIFTGSIGTGTSTGGLTLGDGTSVTTPLPTSCDSNKYCFLVNVTNQYKDIADKQTTYRQAQDTTASVTFDVMNDLLPGISATQYQPGIYYFDTTKCTNNCVTLSINGLTAPVDGVAGQIVNVFQNDNIQTHYSQHIIFDIHVKRDVTDSAGNVDTVDEPNGMLLLSLQTPTRNVNKYIKFSQGIAHIDLWVDDVTDNDLINKITVKNILGNSAFTSQSCPYPDSTDCVVKFTATTYPIYVPDFLSDQNNIITEKPYYQSPLYQVNGLKIGGQRLYDIGTDQNNAGQIIGFHKSYPRTQLNFSYLPSKHKTLMITCSNTDTLQSTIYGIGPNLQNTFKTCPVNTGEDIISLLYCGYDKSTQKVKFRVLHVGTLTKDLTVTNDDGKSLPFYYLDTTDPNNPVKIQWSGSISLLKGFITNINSLDNIPYNIPISGMPTTIDKITEMLGNAGVKTSSGLPAKQIDDYDKPSLTYFLQAMKTGSTENAISPAVQNFLNDINNEITPKQITKDTLCGCTFKNSVIDCAK